MWYPLRYRFIVIALCTLLIIVGIDAKVGMAQIPFLPQVQTPSLDIKDLESKVVSSWVYLDGRRLFQIAAPRASINERLRDINQKLTQISKSYLESNDGKLNVQVQTLNGSPVIYVNDQYLLTVTQEDAKLRQVQPQILATNLEQEIEDSLKQAKRERRPEFIINQSKIAVAIGGGNDSDELGSLVLLASFQTKFYVKATDFRCTSSQTNYNTTETSAKSAYFRSQATILSNNSSCNLDGWNFNNTEFISLHASN